MKNLKIFKNIFIKFLNNENNLLYKVINFIVVFIVLFIIIFFQPSDRIEVKENEVLKRSIIAKKDIKYYDEKATKRNEEIIKLTTPPIFIFNKDYIKFQQEKIKNLFEKGICSTEEFEKLRPYYEKLTLELSYPKEYQFINSYQNHFKFIAKEYSLDYMTSLCNPIYVLQSQSKMF